MDLPYLLGFEMQLESLFFSDSDGQFDFQELPHFLSLIQYCDIVIGYRLTRKDPFHRKLNPIYGQS